MNPVERVVRAVDERQQRSRAASFVFGVVKKFGDDRGGMLAALLTYYGFLALFPLLLVVTTVLGFLAGHNSSFANRLLSSALGEFPIIGNQLRANVHSLRGSGIGLAVGIIGLLWGTRGVTDIAQFTMQEVWAVPNVHRPGFPARVGRGALLLLVLLAAVVSATAVGWVAGRSGHGAIAEIVSVVISAAVNVGLFVLGFTILTGSGVRPRQHLPGAVVAGCGWALLQLLGGYLVGHQLKHASQVYGVFGLVLGLLSWLYLTAQLTVYAAEINVVAERRLWPRSIVQPPLTEADRDVLASIAEREERRPEEEVDVSFPRRAATRASAPRTARRAGASGSRKAQPR